MTHRSALLETYIVTFHDQGYVSVPCHAAQADYEDLFDAFENVIDDVFTGPTGSPNHLADAFRVEHPGRALDSKAFIEHRVRGETSTNEIGRAPGTDNKYQLHFTSRSAEHVQTFFGSASNVPDSIKTLVSRCTDLQAVISESVRPITDILGLTDTLFSPTEDPYNNVHVLRLLKYVAQPPSPYPLAPLADLHFDRSVLTAAVLESRPGLVGAAGNNEVGDPHMTREEFDDLKRIALSTPITHRENEMKLFLGAGYNHLQKEVHEVSGKLPLLFHGVRDEHPGEERLAAVCFINEHIGIHKPYKIEPKETDATSIRNALVIKSNDNGSTNFFRAFRR